MENGFNQWMMRMAFALLIIMIAAAMLALCGCAGTTRALTSSASGKNLGLDGFVMLGELETANPETATPQGRMIMGRVTYKSRRVGIPADQKVPTAGNFRATKTKSLLGTEEMIIEYDFTAGSDADAEKVAAALKAKQEAAAKAFAETDKGNPVTPDKKTEGTAKTADAGSEEKHP